MNILEINCWALLRNVFFIPDSVVPTSEDRHAIQRHRVHYVMCADMLCTP